MRAVGIVAGVVGIVATAVGLVFVAAVANGLVLSILWGWFMVPTLGLPEIGIPQAIGISMVAGYITYQSGAENKSGGDSGEAIKKLVALVLLRPVVVLALGWIVVQFM